MPFFYVFRAFGLPGDATISDFDELQKFLKDSEKLEIIDPEIVPSCPPDDTVTGLFGVASPLPEFLAKQKGVIPQPFYFELRGEDVQVDRTFFGLTQMYPTTPGEPIVADIVALPGLDGHAYGSFKGKGNLQRMWLRHFFKKHFPNCRTMAYGYNSNLRSKSIHTIQDYSRQFLITLQKLREKNDVKTRPLIFIGQSFGGILLERALIMAQSLEENRPLVTATFAILFFGTPHRGMPVKNLVDAMKEGGNNRTDLLEEIKVDSPELHLQVNHFRHLCTRLKIYSFYERDQTQEVMVRPDGSWARTGEYMTAVGDNSALLGLPKEIEEPIPVDADHSNMVKFETRHDRIYQKVHEIIHNALLEAPKEIASRFDGDQRLHFMVPFSRNGQFVGRSETHSLLRSKLDSVAGRHQRIAICGLGGLGKTQDVLDFVYEFEGLCSVFWIHASNQARFTKGYKELAELVGLPGHDDPDKDIRPVVKRWLESPASGNWIIIFDNADSILDFYPETQPNYVPIEDGGSTPLARLVPFGTKGTVMVTTRDETIAHRITEGNVLRKGKMCLDDAMRLLKAHCRDITESENESLEELLGELQYLPLAIVQAAAYLREAHLTSVPEYLGYLKKGQKSRRSKSGLRKLFKDADPRRDLDVNRDITNNATAIFTTFHITFEQIRKQFPLADVILRVMACIDRQGMPYSLIQGIKAEDGNVDELAYKEALSRLIDFSLLTARRDGRDFASFEMHALVHHAMQEFLSSRNELDKAVETTAEILARKSPEPQRETYEVWEEYLPHVLAIVDTATVQLKDIGVICFFASQYCLGVGRYIEAENCCRKSFELRRNLLGPEHPDTLKNMVQLAWVYRKQFKYDEAVQLAEQHLELASRLFGPDAQETIYGAHTLAVMYGSGQERYKDAEELQLKVVEANTKQLGPDHLDTLTCIHDLAWIYGNGQSRWDEAEKLSIRVMEVRKRELGEEHESTLQTMSSLAEIYSKQGRFEESAELQEKALEAMMRVLGPDDPAILGLMSSLAAVLGELTRFEEAEKLEQEVLEVNQRRLGEDHPVCLFHMSNLAFIYAKSEQWKKAEELEAQVVEAKKKIFGPENRQTWISMHSLGWLMNQQGRLTEAENLHWEVGMTNLNLLGERDINTLNSMSNIAHSFRAQGRFRAAINLMRRVADIRAEVLGENHRDTLLAIRLWMRFIDQNLERWAEGAPPCDIADPPGRKWPSLAHRL